MLPKKAKKEFYDKENQKPVIKTSICTGKQMAGFRDIHTGKFTEAMLIRDSRDLDIFLEEYDVSVAEITNNERMVISAFTNSFLSSIISYRYFYFLRTD